MLTNMAFSTANVRVILKIFWNMYVTWGNTQYTSMVPYLVDEAMEWWLAVHRCNPLEHRKRLGRVYSHVHVWVSRNRYTTHIDELGGSMAQEVKMRLQFLQRRLVDMVVREHCWKYNEILIPSEPNSSLAQATYDMFPTLDQWLSSFHRGSLHFLCKRKCLSARLTLNFSPYPTISSHIATILNAVCILKNIYYS